MDSVVSIITLADVRIKRLEQREFLKFGVRILRGGDIKQNHREFISWAKTNDSAGIDSRSKMLPYDIAQTDELPRCER